jgi:hypothetical protein
LTVVTPQLRFEPEGHKYFLKERQVPSVTDVLEPLQQLDGVPIEALEHARIRGQHVHSACHLMIHKLLEWRTLDPVLVPYVSAAKKMIEELEIKVLVSEYRMADEGLRVAGTLDIIGIMKRNTCLFDWKSSAAMPRTAGPQTAAYDHLYRRNLGGRPMKRYGVLLTAEGTYKLYPFEDSRDFTWFTSALNIWHWRAVANLGDGL